MSGGRVASSPPKPRPRLPRRPRRRRRSGRAPLGLGTADLADVLGLEGAAALGVEALVQGHRPLVAEDRGQLLGADLRQPLPELVQVRDRGREADEADPGGREDQALFPDRAALPVVHEVHLVEDHVLDVVQGLGAVEDRVAQDLRGHDQDLGLRADRHVPGHQAHVDLRVVPEVPVLLVREGLDRGREDAAAAALDRVDDGVLRHQGLAGPGGGADQDVAAAPDGRDGLALEAGEVQVLPDLRGVEVRALGLLGGTPAGGAAPPATAPPTAHERAGPVPGAGRPANLGLAGA